ncbi:DNA-3-methyladenine glycosylase [Candidatus Woesearchaeota archaeon]|nr:DNA-3-methyladenine glycosylase [Candidatus Woesearchaeota archaeon]
MSLDTDLENQSKVMSLVGALKKLDQRTKDSMIETLSRQSIYDLLQNQEDVEAVQAKLSGRRIPLTPEQKDIATVIQYLPGFEAVIGPWLGQAEQAYAVEFVLAHYDARKEKFTDKGTAANIANKVGFDEIQTLRRHSAYSDELKKVYRWRHRKRDINFNEDAGYVARALIGRNITLEVSPEFVDRAGTYKVKIIETEAFETDKEVTKSRYCMRAAPGQLDVMPHRGQNLLNVGTHKVGEPSCVMIRAVDIGGNVIEGPGRVGSALSATGLRSLVLGINIPIEGITAPSGFIPGTAEYSLGKYKMQ